MEQTVDARIVDVLKQYRLTDSEIEDMRTIAPMLDVTTFEEFTANCKVLVKYGYPKSDLDYLFLANPNLFVVSPEDLDTDLKELSANCDDIEMALKTDPALIG